MLISRALSSRLIARTPTPFRQAVQDVRKQLNLYQDQLDETIRQGYCDTVKAEHVQGLITDLIKLLDKVDNGANNVSQPQAGPNVGMSNCGTSSSKRPKNKSKSWNPSPATSVRPHLRRTENKHR